MKKIKLDSAKYSGFTTNTLVFLTIIFLILNDDFKNII